MKPVRWGVLGAAKFAREHMAPAIHAARGAELYALATSDAAVATGFRIALDARALKEPDATYRALSAHLALDGEEFLQYAGEKDDPYEILASRVSKEAGEAVVALDSPGIIVEHERWRTYPAGTKAAPTIGFVAFDDENLVFAHGADKGIGVDRAAGANRNQRTVADALEHVLPRLRRGIPRRNG